MPGDTPFYVYAHDTPGTRAVIVFPSRYDAGEWWRAISSLDIAPNTFQRSSPRIYSYHATKAFVSSGQGMGYSGGLMDFFHSQIYGSIAPQISRRMFMIVTYNNEPGPDFIPEQKVVDYLNGRSFYIRSNDDPKLFWYYPTGNAQGYNLSASTTARTRFRVTAADTNLAKGTILIRSDKVIIQIMNGLYVSVSEDTGKLFGSNQPYEFLFGDLIGRKYDGADESELEVSEGGVGEAWELA